MMATYEAVVYVLTKHYRTAEFYAANGTGSAQINGDSVNASNEDVD